jgi:hypothetical protein
VAEAGNIGRKDGSQPPFDMRLGHKDCPNRDFGLSLWSRMGECLLTQECPLWVISKRPKPKSTYVRYCPKADKGGRSDAKCQ